MEESKEPPIKQATGKIQPIAGETVHRICSGQVVLNLAVAVKELVENSLDAGATTIDVRLRNYGTELIEVSDNGCGVTEDNFSALTLKHHTSKLSEYSDLLNVASFGFRGEALSSLCALSDLTITTRHASSEFATKIEYDHKGCITKTTPCSRQVGTTVTLTNLFSTLPVRLKEFQKNSKREFNKMTQLLYAYCLISVGVKITCTNQTSSNAKSVVVATQGSNSIKDNIASVFGFKQLQSIMEMKPHYVPNIKDNILKGLSGETVNSEVSDDVDIEDVEIDLSDDSNDNDPDETLTQESVRSQKSQGHKNAVCPVNFDAFISSCAHGSGRSSTDRQFYYVNSRPCEPPKVIKLINEVYRQFNGNQYPFVLLNINLDRTSVDVNVTPDKRKVFLTKEKAVLDVIKSSMLKVFEDIPRTVKIEKPVAMSSSNRSIRNVEENTENRLHSFLNRFSSKKISDNTKSASSDIKTKSDLKRKSSTMLDFVSSKTIKTDDHVNENDNILHDDDMEIKDSLNNIEHNKSSSIDAAEHIENCDETVIKNEASEKDRNQEILFLEATDTVPLTQIRKLDEVIIEKSHTIRCKPDKVKLANHFNSPSKNNVPSTSKNTIVTDKRDLGKNNRKTVQLKTSIEHVKALTEIYNNQKEKRGPDKVKFRSGINPVFNKTCEEELSKEISKDSFKQMEVVGQFNLGFIIARLDDDLFIIDQHATDEIYNFETLQKTTELTNQKLVIPQQLELTGVNEQTLMDNLEVFRKNGFTFEINEGELPTKRVKLLTIPMSKNWVFGKSDIEELLFMLRESPSEYCRPSRVRAMFASRACRKSVMIGTALDKADMKRLVDHMAEIDKPWNCPHGRPTIRHLVNIAVVHTKQD